MVIIVFGVSGSGKSTIGNGLSEKLGIPYYDADDFHPQENILKMSNGQSLNDQDRLPWLKILAKNIGDWSKGKGGVLACSALKENYRAILSSESSSKINWVYLAGTKELIKARMDNRKGHYMSSILLNSQFADLEVPEYGIHADISQTPDMLIKEIITKL